jgi:hypothetical protein
MTRALRVLAAWLLLCGAALAGQPPAPPTASRTSAYTAAPIVEAFLVYGQSNAGNGGASTLSMTQQMFPSEAVDFSTGQQVWGGTAITPSAISGMAGVQNTTALPLTIQVAAAFALQQFMADEGLVPTRHFSHSVSNGGQPISVFQRGTVTNTNLMIAANRFATAVPLFGATPIVRAIVWVQGESSTTNYAADITTLISTVVPDVMAQTGQSYSPKFLIFQINNTQGDNTYNQVVVDQLSVSQAVTGALMIGPMYYTPLDQIAGATSTSIHGVEIGRMQNGEILAYCYRTIFVDQKPWTPLQPLSITRSGAVITVHYSTPTGGAPLAWDTTFVGAAANYGYLYTSDTSETIQSVTLGGDGYSVVITLTATPTGVTRSLSYANGGASILAPWSAARGQLISATTQPSLYYRLGYAVPQYVTHYAVRSTGAVP